MTEVASPDRRLFELVRKLGEAKRLEDEAKAARIRVEEEIVEAAEFTKPKGSETRTVGGKFGSAKFTMKQNVYTKVDAKALTVVRKALGQSRFKKVFRAKYDVLEKGLADLLEENRDLYLIAAEAIIRNPGKVSIELKSLEVL